MGACELWPTVKPACAEKPRHRASPNRPMPNCFSIVCIALYVGLVIECGAVTKSGDIQGLNAIRYAIVNHDNDFIESWDESVDPCSGSWRGVTCNCSIAQNEKPRIDFECESVEETLEQRVISLELGCKQCRTNAHRLNGTISPDLSRLDQLRYLDLSMNNLEGPLPNSLQELKELRFLSVSDNKLSGTLPSFIGDLLHLQQLEIDSNEFSGSIPQDWCTPDFNLSKVIVHNNLGLCGTVPTCLQDEEVEEDDKKIPLTSNTYLRRSSADSIGVCDTTPPECHEQAGCKVLVPDNWTHLGKVQFYFYDLFDPESGVPEYSFELREEGLDIPVVEEIIAPTEEMNVTKVVVKLKSNESIEANRTYVDFNFPGLSLKQGAYYKVKIIARNGAGPPMTRNFTSKSMLVDNTAPEGGDIRLDLAQTEDANLTLSWTSFEDEESNVTDISVLVKKMTDEGQVVNVTSLEVPVSENSTEVPALLEPDTLYKAFLFASNGAGLESVTVSDTFSVEEYDKQGNSLSTKDLIIAIVLCLCAGFIAMGILVVYIGHARQKLREKYPKSLGDFMESLLDTGCDQPKHRPEVVNEHKEMAFVVTDLEGSTEMSNYSETGFKTLTVIHDQIMRNGIAAHAGYEINTEGDSFLVAFTSVVDAVLFCMETQYNLRDAKWPYEVLKLPKCRIEKTVDNEVIFRGPRVRMAIHWADEIANKLHPTTKCRVFEGPGFELTKEISDAANGGQVLLTHHAWLKLQNSMGIAGFPVINQIGEFHIEQFSGWEEKTIWLYQVTELTGRPLHRTFPPPRKLTLVNEGWGLNIVRPPIPPVSRPYLAFVAVRVVFQSDDTELPVDVGEMLFTVLASVAQPFKGYIYSGSKSKGRALLTFAKTSDAVRYSHAIQVALLYTKWPDGIEQYVGPSEFGPVGHPIFSGPRVAIAIHFSKHYTTHAAGDSVPNQGQWLHYEGPGQMLVKELSKVANGGQVVLSEPAWSSVQDRLPGQTQTISLGKHILGHGFNTPQLLMEVLPEMLKDRVFEDLATEQKLEPGYRDSPSDTQNIAIVFVKAIKPKDALNAEQRKGTESSTDAASALQILKDYHTSLNIFSALVREWLPKYNGYECKEPETGKLTLAFWDVDQAIRWCAHVQIELLEQDWPPGLLNMEGCGEVYADTGELLRKGLRVRMGMAYGLPGMKKPLSSGRADYFGHLPNLAARVFSLAAPGQILVECSPGFGDKVSWFKDGSVGLIPFEGSEDSSPVDNAMGAIQIRQLGHYYLKGFDDNLKLIYQALPLNLLKREYEMQPVALRVADVGRLNSLRAEPMRLALKRKRDLFSRIRIGCFFKISEGFVGVCSFGNNASLRSSPTPHDSVSTLESPSQLQLHPSPRNSSGSPQKLRQIDLVRLDMNNSNSLVPSPGPSQTNLDDIMLESQGSWGDSMYQCYSRSGSAVSVTSRGQSSTWRSPQDGSSSPPLVESPFFEPDVIAVAEDEPSPSLSLRHLRNSDDGFPNMTRSREWELQPSSLVQRESNDSIVSAKSQSSYVQELAGLWVSRLRESKQNNKADMDPDSSGSGHEFNFPVVGAGIGGPASTRADSDIENQVPMQDLRALSAPEFRREGWLSGFGDEYRGLHMTVTSRENRASQIKSFDCGDASAGSSRSS